MFRFNFGIPEKSVKILKRVLTIVAESPFHSSDVFLKPMRVPFHRKHFLLVAGKIEWQGKDFVWERDESLFLEVSSFPNCITVFSHSVIFAFISATHRVSLPVF